MAVAAPGAGGGGEAGAVERTLSNGIEYPTRPPIVLPAASAAASDAAMVSPRVERATAMEVPGGAQPASARRVGS
jgi:hypothetical protein